MKYLVAGGAGFIGSNLALRLAEGGNGVVVLDDMSLGRERNVPRGVVLVRGDTRDQQVIGSAADGVEGIFFDAARSSSPMFHPDPREGVDVNLKGFMNVMEVARRGDLPVVYASTSSLYSRCEPPHREEMPVKAGSFYEYSFYCREMAAALYAELYGLRVVGLRYFSVYGPREEHKGQYANNISQFMWGMMRGEAPVIYGDGSQTRDFIHVDDVVEANLLAMESGLKGEVFNVGTGVETSFNRVVELLNGVLGTDLKPRYVPNPVRNYVVRTRADTGKAERMLGFRARIPLREGIERTAEYYRRQGLLPRAGHGQLAEPGPIRIKRSGKRRQDQIRGRAQYVR